MSHNNTKPSSLTPTNTNPSSLTPSITNPRKRLIIKLSYPPGFRKRLSDSCGTDENKRRKFEHSVRPKVTGYWVDSNYKTKTAPFSQPNHDNVVEINKMIKNHVSNTQPKDNNIDVDNKKMIKNHVSNTVMPQPKDNNIDLENKKMIKNHVSNTVMSQPKDNHIDVENKKTIKNHVSKTARDEETSKLCTKSILKMKDSSKTARAEESSRLCTKSILMVKDSSKTTSVTRAEECASQKPMECVKRRQCWLILKRMLVGRDGWDLKDPPAKEMVENAESKILEKKLKPIGLNEIERKLRLYDTPDEFASDMRLVFSNAMLLYPPRNHIFQIARKFSENFEEKWKSLKETWELEDRRKRKAHKSRRY